MMAFVRYRRLHSRAALKRGSNEGEGHVLVNMCTVLLLRVLSGFCSDNLLSGRDGRCRSPGIVIWHCYPISIVYKRNLWLQR